MRGRVVVPVTLGCCPEDTRCLLCPPAPTVDAALVDALVHHYTTERAAPGEAIEVRFFGGPPPTDAQLAAAGDRPITCRVRPDLLTRAEARRLLDAGVRTLELDALTFHDPSLRQIGRPHRASLLREQADGLVAMGFEVGVVLAPGLPGHSFDDALADAREAAGRFTFARLHPVLVLDHSGLRELHSRGRFVPLTLGQTITVCRAMLDLLDDGGVEVLRVGLQPGPDGFGRAVAGPVHSGLRELVEQRRVLDRLRGQLVELGDVRRVTVHCAPADETRTRGHLNGNVRTLRAEFGLDEVRVRPDPKLARGQLEVVAEGATGVARR